MELTTDKQKQNRKYYLANKEKCKLANKIRRDLGLDKKNMVTERRGVIKRRYNLEWDTYVAFLEAANYKCQICYKPLQLVSRKTDEIESASVDHCHITNKIRGVLCRSCNVALGHFKDSRLHLINAITYLDTHGA